MTYLTIENTICRLEASTPEELETRFNNIASDIDSLLELGTINKEQHTSLVNFLVEVETEVEGLLA